MMWLRTVLCSVSQSITPDLSYEKEVITRTLCTTLLSYHDGILLLLLLLAVHYNGAKWVQRGLEGIAHTPTPI